MKINKLQNVIKEVVEAAREGFVSEQGREGERKRLTIVRFLRLRDELDKELLLKHEKQENHGLSLC